jgi:hypothetical protein
MRPGGALILGERQDQAAIDLVKLLKLLDRRPGLLDEVKVA